MAVRNSAKGIVLDEGKILLNKCRSRLGRITRCRRRQQTRETLPAARTPTLARGDRITSPTRMAGVYSRSPPGGPRAPTTDVSLPACARRARG